jgi:copper chaperone CopZ
MSGFAAKEMHATQCVTMIEECLTETPVPPLEVLMM